MQQDVAATVHDTDIAFELRKRLAEHLGRDRFDLWFGNVRIDFVDGRLNVTSPDDFSSERLKRKHLRDIHTVCAQFLEITPPVRFQVHSASEIADAAADNPADSPQTSGAIHTASSAVPNQRASRPYASLKSFVVGESNQLAFTSVRMAVERPGTMSPLFLYGPPGTGKTHLLEGIWSAIRAKSGVRRTVLLSAEQFTSDFLQALRGGGLPGFRRKVRDLDLLVIDDVHFFSGKRATLVELQHTVDTLLRSGRQLVFAADRSPAELTGLGAELAARMSGGLVCGIEPADQPTRRRILGQMAGRCEADFSGEVLDLVAANVSGDARHLSGALNRLDATSAAFQRSVTTEMAADSLTDFFRSTQRLVRLPDIERAVCEVFGLDEQSLQSGGKARAISQPRMLAMWLARKYTRAAFSEIGDYFGRRSHSTVISAQKKVDRWMTDESTLKMTHGTCRVEEAIRRVESRLRTG